MTPGRGGYQSTNLPYTNEQIPESYESVSVEIQARGVDIDADRAAVAEQIDITADDIRSERHGRMRCVGPIDHTPAGVSPGVTPEKAAGRGSGAPCARATRLQPRASPKFSS
jgi:hypothetical protein